jgi:DNA modification methylase
METSHSVRVGDSRDMAQLEDDSVELVVTSPPYPMIEMWDGLFSELDPGIERELAAENGQAAFELMHEELDAVWDEVSRVLVDGGIACVNIGDATRKVDESFRVYQNHARIVTAFEERGFEPLPDVLWRKPVNSATKFMGSGMIPPNAYVTLEHEYILVFRNGKTQRQFEPGSEQRYNSAYFWEERNRWFTDVWEDVNGTYQSLDHNALRDRSGAFPFEIPYRLINMYSVYGDTVLDPFWGTGTTTIAAMIAGRNSVGYEIEDEFTQLFEERIENISDLSHEVVHKRLDDHREFVEQRRAEGEQLKHESETYAFPVTTTQEKTLQLYSIFETHYSNNKYTVTYDPIETSDPDPR